MYIYGLIYFRICIVDSLVAKVVFYKTVLCVIVFCVLSSCCSSLDREIVCHAQNLTNVFAQICVCIK